MASPSIAACHRMQGDTQAFGQKLCVLHRLLSLKQLLGLLSMNEIGQQNQMMKRL